MEAPHLKLQVLQGPLQGESFEYPPGATVRIGRVVRGNNLPIKDPGISSKHLSILSASNNWFLRDLASSNGTVFDGSNIPPNIPFLLHDGATIKIGELTSIQVTLIHHQHTAAAAAALPPQPRRNPTRRAGSDDAPKQRRGGGKGKVQSQSVEENAIVNGSGFSDPPAAGARVTRNSKIKKGAAAAVSDSSVVDLDTPIGAAESPKKTRATRNSKSKQNVIQISDSSDIEENLVEKPKNTRATRNSKSKKSAVEVSDSNALVEKAVVEEPKKKRVTRNANKGQALRKELERDMVDGVGEDEDDVKAGGDDCGEQKEDLKGGDNLPDLENLSLAEWFDFLQVHLPKQIVDATEEMIDSMRQKAARLREYIILQKNDKGKMPL